MMNKIILFISLAVSVQSLHAQNVGIGTTEPQNKLQVQGSLLVTAPTTATNTAPTAAQTKNMPGLGTLAFMTNTDSTGRLYDSGGPGGNYGIDHDGKATIASNGFCVGIEVTVEAMDINRGDSLIIKESATGAILLAVGNGYYNTGKWLFNSSSLYINFKSNNDFNIGAGFSLLCRRLYDNKSSLPDINGYSGNTFFFDAKKGALRSGIIANDEVGTYSFATGEQTIASGSGSFATGFRTKALSNICFTAGISTTASGYNAFAIGNNTTASGTRSFSSGDQSIASGMSSFASGYSSLASGDFSTAMGYITTASGLYSTALGNNTTASGSISAAFGRITTASGDNSTAMGNYVSTNNQNGSFIIGDNSTTTILNSANDNNFRARFAGGYKLFTSANLATGCTLFAGDNAWTTGSSVHSKENFAPINGEEFLKKIAGFRLTSWNYKTQDPKTFRHYGPMAQDFFAAFGKDEYGTIGNDTTINSADFAGVNFIAIQALEKRTQQIKILETQNEMQKQMLLLLRSEIDELKKENADIRKLLIKK